MLNNSFWLKVTVEASCKMCGMTRDLTTVIFLCNVRDREDQEFRIFESWSFFHLYLGARAQQCWKKTKYILNVLKGLDVHSIPMRLSW